MWLIKFMLWLFAGVWFYGWFFSSVAGLRWDDSLVSFSALLLSGWVVAGVLFLVEFLSRGVSYGRL